MTPHLHVVDDTAVATIDTNEVDETEDQAEEVMETIDSFDPDQVKTRKAAKVGEHELLARASEVGVTIPARTTVEDWAEALRVQARVEKSSVWVLGDLLNHGEDRFGEAASIALNPEDVAPSTASNAQSLCRAYPLPERFAELTSTHHRIALKLKESFRRRALLFAIAQDLNTVDFGNYVEQMVTDIPDSQSERSKTNERPRTHVTFTLSFTLPIGDEEAGSGVQDKQLASLQRLLKKDGLEPTKVSPNVSYPTIRG